MYIFENKRHRIFYTHYITQLCKMKRDDKRVINFTNDKWTQL